MTNKFISLLEGAKILYTAISSSLGIADANKIISTNEAGKIDNSFLPSGMNVNSLNSSRGFRMFEDFVCSVGAFSITYIGVGSSISPVNTACKDLGGHPGICQIGTGSTATGFARLGALSGDNMDRILFGYGSWELETLLQIPFLRTSTDEYYIQIGFIDGTNFNNMIDGIIFYYSSSSIYWMCKCSSNSVYTTYETSVEVQQALWYKLRIQVNPTATSADFYINDILVTTITTNIPKGTGRQTQLALSILKTVGTTNRIMLVDYLDVAYLATVPR